MKTAIAGTRPPAVHLLATVALISTTALAGACGPRRPPAQPPAAPTPRSATQTLLASVPDGDEGAFRFTVKDDEASGSGVVDAASKGLTVSFDYRDLGLTMKVEFLVVGQRSWMKVRFAGTAGLSGLPKLPKRWLLLDPAKVVGSASTPMRFDDADPGGAGGRLDTVRLQVPAVDRRHGYEYRVTYTGYGTAPKVSPPSPADSQIAPAEAYELINS